MATVTSNSADLNGNIELAATSSANKHERPPITEVPENLKRLVLMLVKAFYGVPYYLVVNYIQRANPYCVKEEMLRDTLKLEQKYLRQLLIELKVEKIIKERLVTEEIEGGGGRSRKHNYYHVNYKAVLNVVKYKFNHMREKLTIRDKDELHCNFQCSNEACAMQYNAMDVGKIYNPMTEEMRCWQCGQIVLADDSASPSTMKNSLARFNEQMAGIFSVLQTLDGIRFSAEILEPPVPSVSIASSTTAADGDEQTTPVSQSGEPSPTLEGERKQPKKPLSRPLNVVGKTRSELYGGAITVSIGDDMERVQHEKEAIPWLQSRPSSDDSTSTTLHNVPTSTITNSAVSIPTTSVASAAFPSHMVRPSTTPVFFTGGDFAVDEERDEADVGSAAKRPKLEKKDIVALLMEEEGESLHASGEPSDTRAETRSEEKLNEFPPKTMIKPQHAEEDEDDDDYVMVEGMRVHIEQISEEMVAKMTPAEKEVYVRAVQNSFVDFY